MISNLDTEVLKTFLAIDDTGSCKPAGLQTGSSREQIFLKSVAVIPTRQPEPYLYGKKLSDNVLATRARMNLLPK